LVKQNFSLKGSAMVEAALNITLGSEEILIPELGLVDENNPQS
jgi:hypothetical protein